ncbi:MAG: hypothetical protein JNK02_07350 [Planctomycetes bacterium]|nr:hypothetical protein [Planctomycetota bacterium]
MDPRARRSRRPLDLAAAAAFLAALAAPTADRLARPSAVRDVRHENRAPAPFPAPPRAALAVGGWSRGFERWFDDTHGLRDVLLGARNAALLAARLPPTPVLEPGDGGWIFFRGDLSFEAHRGTHPLLARRAAEWATALEERRAWLAERGVRFLFVVVPDKETVYAERLPDTWTPLGPGAFDLLLDELRARTGVEVLDLRPVLRAARAGDRPAVEDFLYFPRGTHWTLRGACAANEALVARLASSSPGLRAPECGSVDPVLGGVEGEDSWARWLYLESALRPVWVLVPAGTRVADVGAPPQGPGQSALSGAGDPSAPAVHLFHDSNGPFLHPFLSASVRRLRATWRASVDRALVAAERPDVVVLLRAERMLSLPPDPDVLDGLVPERADSTPRWSLAAGAARVEVLEAGQLEPTEGGTRWTSTAWSDRFVVDLTGLVAPGEGLGVDCELEGEGAGVLDLVPGVAGPDEWNGPGAVALRFQAGRLRESVAFPAGAPSGRLVVRVGPAGAWLFRRLEVRAWRAPAALQASSESGPTIRSK